LLALLDARTVDPADAAAALTQPAFAALIGALLPLSVTTVLATLASLFALHAMAPVSSLAPAAFERRVRSSVLTYLISINGTVFERRTLWRRILPKKLAEIPTALAAQAPPADRALSRSDDLLPGGRLRKDRDKPGTESVARERTQRVEGTRDPSGSRLGVPPQTRGGSLDQIAAAIDPGSLALSRGDAPARNGDDIEPREAPSEAGSLGQFGEDAALLLRRERIEAFLRAGPLAAGGDGLPDAARGDAAWLATALRRAAMDSPSVVPGLVDRLLDHLLPAELIEAPGRSPGLLAAADGRVGPERAAWASVAAGLLRDVPPSGLDDRPGRRAVGLDLAARPSLAAGAAAALLDMPVAELVSVLLDPDADRTIPARARDEAPVH
jgi:hypothetical protein